MAGFEVITEGAEELGSPTEAPDGPNRALIDHAWSLANEGKLTNAETLFAKAISRGDDPEAFRSYGAFLLRLGRRALAGVMFERIVELAGEPPGLWHAIAYGNLGLLRELSGDLVEAEQYQRKSLQIHEQRGARDRIATVHLNLGIIAKRRGQFSVAEAEFREAAALALEIGREETVSQAYNNLGILYRITGDPHRARQMHREALAIADRLELHQQVTTACTNLAIACTEIGELSTTREMFGRALSISQQIGFEEAIAFCLAGIGRIHLIEEQPELALASLLDALQTIRRLDRSDATANILVNLAAVYGRLGKMLEATRHMQEAFDISGAIPDPLGEALAAFNLGALRLIRNQQFAGSPRRVAP